jgi:hypothetical protein
MSAEIENLVASFRAVVTQEQLSHRQVDGAGAIASFEKNVRDHQARYVAKFDGLRADDSRDAAAAHIDAAEAQVGKIADEAIEAAKAARVVEVA